jgi:hypothetical protein
MESELRQLLIGLDDSVVGKLATNDVRSLNDAKDLTADDLKELGFAVGTRNKLLKLFADPAASMPVASPVPANGLGAKWSGEELTKFKSVFEACSGQDAASKAKRERLYPCWDTNGNGFLSLAEVDLGIKTTLIGELKDKVLGEHIWRRFRKSYIRAFVDAADAAPQRGGKAYTNTGAGGKRRSVDDDDYVTRREFRLLICYLCTYAAMYELFAAIDGSSEGVTVEDDNRITPEEWEAALPLITSAASSWAPFVALQTATAESFQEIDLNKGGYVLLTELCEWLELGEKRANTPTGILLGVGEDVNDGQRTYGSPQ